MRISNKIVLASTNGDKLEEFKALLRPYGDLELIAADEVIRNADKLGLVEKYETYLENAVAKARTANMGAHYPCLADDTGLEVQALEGKPGIRTHRYAIPKSGESQDIANVNKLLIELKGVSPERRTARFVTTLALVEEGILLSATGTLEGTIAEEPRGSNGFGYDPVFVPKGSNKTLAEMTNEQKNSISHRAAALKALFEEIRTKGIVLAKP